ncbi:MAG: FAD-binding oxidoreductase [Planctomyces sp.]|jgi:glycolate oxidase
MNSESAVSDAPPCVITPLLLRTLAEIVGPDRLLDQLDERLVYECDGYIVEKTVPDVVVFPDTADHVARIIRACRNHRIPYVARGAGTSLAGGCLPVGGGVMIAMTRMNRILEINLRDRYAVVEPGVVNVRLTRALAGSGFHYAPDPSSQGSCTIGGNVSTNSGGPHTLKYGVTVNHVRGVEYVSTAGELIQLGGPCGRTDGLDLTGLFVGSEGTFGVVTKVWVGITRDPEGCRTMLGVFETVDDATRAISAIIGAGIVPAALEMMDQGIIGALEAAYSFGFPLDAGAVLLIEVDGLECSVDDEAATITELCMKLGAREVRRSRTEEERMLLWKCRKQAFGAIGRLSHSYCTQDGVVPRTRLPEILTAIQESSERHQIRIVNVFHAGDGNIHPVLLFDERDKEQVHRVMLASKEILNKCIELGGSVTGEHGIGVEKISFMNRLFTADDLDVMREVRQLFNPDNLCSPGKMLPTAGGCGTETIEMSRPGRRAAM